MFRLIQQFFPKKKNTKLCQVVFSLDTSGNFSTELLWPDLHLIQKENVVLIASEYSAMIFGLMKGHFEQDIIQALDSGKNTTNTEDIKFIDLINYNCKILENTRKKILSSPLISPSHVFKK